MSENKQTYWIIGDKKVDSQLEAYKLALRDTKTESRLYFQEDEFDKINWTNEPTKSWEELCLEHAIRLRQKWKKIKLFFSAGRDSGHVFRVFEQAKIPIDELIIPYTPYSPLRMDEHFNHILPIAKELCRRNPGMTIREVIQDKEWYEKLYKNSDWVTIKNKQFNVMFLQRKWDELIRRDLDYDSGSCGYIFGFEKPSIKLIDGFFYSQVTAQYIQWAPQSTPGVECFYWSNEIYLKQCWMLINHFEKTYPKCDSAFVDLYQRQTEYPDRYDELCKAVGRGEAMSWACGNGLNRVFGNNHWSMTHLSKILKQEKWKSFNEYSSILYDLVKNHTYLINPNTNKIDLNNIAGKKYLIKKQN
jgi:hypothetical protein